MALQADGKLVFGSYESAIRLNQDGSRDTNFVVITSPFEEVDAVTVQKDGKILIGGNFTSINGFPLESVGRLNADGTVDTSFYTAGQDLGDANRVLIEQDDASVLIGGDVVAKLTPQGRLAPDFQKSQNNIPSVLAIALIAGKPLIAGNFYYYPQPVTNIALLTTNGLLDTNFHAANPTGPVETIALQNDCRLIVGGRFTKFDGQSRRYLVRVLGEQPTIRQSFERGDGIALSWPSRFSNWVLQSSTVLPTTNWSMALSPTFIFGSECFVTNSIADDARYFRLVSPP